MEYNTLYLDENIFNNDEDNGNDDYLMNFDNDLEEEEKKDKKK